MIISVSVDDAVARAIDDVAAEMAVETGFRVTRSDILKQAIREFLQSADIGDVEDAVTKSPASSR